MALCEKTLRHWLDERIEPTPISMIASIATQILCGLNYIHSLKIVHHDIKVTKYKIYNFFTDIFNTIVLCGKYNFIGFSAK